MFYTVDDNGKITASAKFKWADNCLETDKEILRAYDGGLYFAEDVPTKPLDQLKEERKSELSAARDAKIDSGFEFNGNRFYADKGSKGDLVFAILAYQTTGKLPTEWKGIDVIIPITTIEDLMGLATANGLFIEATYNTYFNYFTQIEACTTNAQCEALEFVF